MNVIEGIKTISFDGDGTLWDFKKVMRHSLQHVLKELKKTDPQTAIQLDIDKMIEIRNRVAKKLRGKITNLEEVRLEAFKQTLKDVGRPNDKLASYLNQVYLKHRFEDIELFNDVLPALETLREKYTLGLLSNGNSYPERCGLEGIFQFIVFSQDYGVEKPDPKIFRLALKKSGCSEQEFLHVGDSLENDIMGAVNAGIKCVWVNRQRMKNTLGFKIEYETDSLLKLLEILE
ncbi:HAD family hydrolase [Candidatus Bathyarchaeota archaeon]|nr:HAD family hydrolase [Candidatus Bathyarchaeota archaeon]